MRAAILDFDGDLTDPERVVYYSAGERASVPQLVDARSERRVREAIPTYLDAPIWAQTVR
jgi:hypothetical protein